MTRSAFPLSKPRNRAYRLPSFRWRVVCFDALGQSFRLLVAYNAGKEQYRAILAADYGRDMAVLAQYEFHGTHPGWHILASCDDIKDAPVGMMRHPWQRRIPRARGRHNQTNFKIVNEDHALDRAASFFRLHKSGKGLGI